jgi:hypothetical protein
MSVVQIEESDAQLFYSMIESFTKITVLSIEFTK